MSETKRTAQEMELEEELCNFHAVLGMLSLLWEATEGDTAVCDSVYGIRALLATTIDQLETKIAEVR